MANKILKDKPPAAGRGRPKGALNKTTVAAKEALALAFEGIGGVPALEKWARDNETEFFKLWSKLVPLDVKAEVAATIQVVTGVPRAGDPS